jgi:two-component system, chemotaxis family, chemotaxis protein CheY
MKILLADDDKIERAALRELLGTQPNLEVVEVEDGQAAMDQLCDGLKPDLCIFDIRMPKIDGMELLKRIRRDPQLRPLKIVMTSATRDRETILTLAKHQISGYLLKPYETAKVKAVLQPLLATATDPQLASRNLLAKTVLLAESDAATLDHFVEIIKKEPGWECVSAKNGQDALSLLHEGLRPDLIFAALKLPGIDGTEFVSRLRDDVHLRKIRIVMISDAYDRETIRILSTHGIDSFLHKPLTPSKVTDLLRGKSSITDETMA